MRSKGKTVTVGKMVEMGTNVAAYVEGGVLHLSIKLDEDHGRTAKNFRRIGTTHGNKGIPDHPEIHLGLNIYDKATG